MELFIPFFTLFTIKFFVEISKNINEVHAFYSEIKNLKLIENFNCLEVKYIELQKEYDLISKKYSSLSKDYRFRDFTNWTRYFNDHIYDCYFSNPSLNNFILLKRDNLETLSYQKIELLHSIKNNYINTITNNVFGVSGEDFYNSEIFFFETDLYFNKIKFLVKDNIFFSNMKEGFYTSPIDKKELFIKRYTDFNEHPLSFYKTYRDSLLGIYADIPVSLPNE